LIPNSSLQLTRNLLQRLLCSPSASHGPSCNGSHGHLHWPPHLTESAATCSLASSSQGACHHCDLHISWRLVRRPCSPRHRATVPCLRCSQDLPSAANLDMVVARTWCCTRPPCAGAPCSSAHHVGMATARSSIAPPPAGELHLAPATFTSRRRPPPLVESAITTVVGFSGIAPPLPRAPRSSRSDTKCWGLRLAAPSSSTSNLSISISLFSLG
jgi:hypothetical protein